MPSLLPRAKSAILSCLQVCRSRCRARTQEKMPEWWQVCVHFKLPWHLCRGPRCVTLPCGVSQGSRVSSHSIFLTWQLLGYSQEAALLKSTGTYVLFSGNKGSSCVLLQSFLETESCIWAKALMVSKHTLSCVLIATLDCQRSSPI